MIDENKLIDLIDKHENDSFEHQLDLSPNNPVYGEEIAVQDTLTLVRQWIRQCQTT
jgi:hypothetical protein